MNDFFYRSTFFSNDSTSKQFVEVKQDGIDGIPIDRPIAKDDIVVGLLIFCFVLTLIAVNRLSKEFAREAKSFIHPERREYGEAGAYRGWTMIMANVQTCIILSVISFLYISENIAITFTLSSEYPLIAILTGYYIVYFLLKNALYAIVNSVFFPSKKNEQWTRFFLCITAVEGILLLPALVLIVFFSFNTENILTYIIFTLGFVKILTFYRAFSIFFRQNTLKLQIILYLCALEIIPLVSWGTILKLIIDNLTINY